MGSRLGPGLSSELKRGKSNEKLSIAGLYLCLQKIMI